MYNDLFALEAAVQLYKSHLRLTTMMTKLQAGKSIQNGNDLWHKHSLGGLNDGWKCRQQAKALSLWTFLHIFNKNF
jgi:hypothetical protein